MNGWTTIEKVSRLEQEVDKLGLKFARYPHGDWTENHNALSLMPKDTESLPIYSRDASIYAGSLEGVEHWLKGVAWAREYDLMLGVSTSKKRDRKEQDQRNKHTLSRVRGETVVQKEQ
jgi:hypothetical protein